MESIDPEILEARAVRRLAAILSGFETFDSSAWPKLLDDLVQLDAMAQDATENPDSNDGFMWQEHYLPLATKLIGAMRAPESEQQAIDRKRKLWDLVPLRLVR